MPCRILQVLSKYIKSFFAFSRFFALSEKSDQDLLLYTNEREMWRIAYRSTPAHC